MRKYRLILFFYVITFMSFAQSDSIPLRGTIKVATHFDSTYIKAFARFDVYRLPAEKRFVNYGDYVRSGPTYSSIQNTNRIKIQEAKPATDTAQNFDYTSYFKNNEFTKGIKMRVGESDTIRLYVSINKKGDVRFNDPAPIEKKGEQLLVYDVKKKEYKIDVSHKKTQKAFDQLASEKWQPAQIMELKTHPSKRKNKYKYSTGYTEGVLIIIYSSSPITE